MRWSLILVTVWAIAEIDADKYDYFFKKNPSPEEQEKINAHVKCYKNTPKNKKIQSIKDDTHWFDRHTPPPWTQVIFYAQIWPENESRPYRTQLAFDYREEIVWDDNLKIDKTTQIRIFAHGFRDDWQSLYKLKNRRK